MSEFSEKMDSGIKHLENEEFDKAIIIAKELQNYEPDSSDGYHLEALCHQYQYHWDKSIEALTKAITHSPYDAGLYSIRGFAYLSLNQFENAEKDFDEAIDLEDSELTHRYKTLWYIVQDRSDEGIEYLVNRLKMKPDVVENWIFMGDLMMRAGLENKAATYYQQAKTIDPEHPDVKSLKL